MCCHSAAPEHLRQICLGLELHSSLANKVADYLSSCINTGTFTALLPASIVSVTFAVILSWYFPSPPQSFIPDTASSNGNGFPCLLSLLPILCRVSCELIVLCDPESTIASTASPSIVTSSTKVRPIAATSPQAVTALTWELNLVSNDCSRLRLCSANMLSSWASVELWMGSLTSIVAVLELCLLGAILLELPAASLDFFFSISCQVPSHTTSPTGKFGSLLKATVLSYWGRGGIPSPEGSSLLWVWNVGLGCSKQSLLRHLSHNLSTVVPWRVLTCILWVKADVYCLLI